MPLRLRPSPLRCPTALSIRSPCLRIVPLGFRSLHDAPASDFASKYADKLQQRAQQKGTSVEELRAKLRDEERERRRKAAAQAEAASIPQKQGVQPTPSASPPTPGTSIRKDSSPVKPLSSFLNLPRLLQTPHTPAQISALWTAYHASRSQGTGRGYICATVPLEAYEKMMGVAKRYPAFIVPVPRQAPLEEGEVEKKAYEFYYLQWAFHEVPEVPTYERLTDPFAALIPPSPSTSPHNPQTSTVLFTPLLEYKLRQTFATPYLVLTHYTDLAQTHGVVLLRGEITPSAASGSGGGGEGWMLSQQDAQLLAVGVQRFYLWGGGGKEEGLLKKFHESPAEFSWEDLLELGDPTAI